MNRSPSILGAGATGLILLGLAVASQFVSLTYGAGGVEPPPVRLEDAPERDHGRLRLVGGSVPVLRLEGTPYEMGRQHGALLKKQIRFLHREYFEALAVRLIGRQKLAEWGKSVDPFLPERYREELRGLAEGSGLSYAQLLMVNVVPDKLQSMMCSTVVASGVASKGGEIYFGRNLDFAGRNLLHRTTVVVVYKAQGVEPVAAVTWPGVIGVLSGMNARGVSGATMMIHFGGTVEPGMPYLLMYRQALERARTAADVYDSIAAVQRTCPNNFMVADADGTAVLIEFDRKRVVRRPAAGGTICGTNHFRTAALESVGVPLGKTRYRRLAVFLEREKGRIDLPAMKRALRSVATPWFLNVQAMVFLPARRTIHLSVGGKLPAAAQPYVRLDPETLFGAGKAKR